MMQEKLIKEIKAHLNEVIAQESPLGQSLWQELLKVHPADIAGFLSDCSHENFKKLFLQLPTDIVCLVFSELPESLQILTLSFLNDAGRMDVLSCLTADKMTDLFENLPDADLKQYLNLLHKKDREKVLSLLKFDSESAGGIMDTDVFALDKDLTVSKAVQLLQRLDLKKELHRQIFVVDGAKRLVGYIVLEDLVLQRPDTHITTFMKKNDLVAYADEDQESVAQKMMHYNVTILPVVGQENYFLGVIPSATLVDVIEEEASENVYRMSAMEPVKGTYFDLTFGSLLYKRSYILVVLLLAQSLSSIIIKHHEKLLEGFLLFYITMLISTGGNASNQTSAVIIQGLACGELNKYNLRRFFVREIILACAMGLVLGLVAFMRVYFTSGNLLGSIAVSSSLAVIVVVSMSVGTVIPFVLKKINVDPAYAAGPFLATLMDVLGLFIYCNVSKLFIIS